jgi:hypothetical protein
VGVSFGTLHGDGTFISLGALNIGPRDVLTAVWTGVNEVVKKSPTFLFGYPFPKYKSGILNNPAPYFGEAHDVTSTGDLESQERFAKLTKSLKKKRGGF